MTNEYGVETDAMTPDRQQVRSLPDRVFDKIRNNEPITDIERDLIGGAERIAEQALAAAMANASRLAAIDGQIINLNSRIDNVEQAVAAVANSVGAANDRIAGLVNESNGVKDMVAKLDEALGRHQASTTTQ